MPLLYWYIRLVLLAGLFLPYKSFATVIDFDLTQVGDVIVASDTTFNQEGLTLTLWAKQDDGGNVLPARIYRDEFGIGVQSTPSDNTELDKLGPDETLFMQFSQAVSLLSFGFTQVGSNDWFSLATSNDNLTAIDIPGGDVRGDLDSGTYDFDNQSLTGTLFEILPGSTYSEFSLARLSVATASVPAPATVLLMALGLLGIHITKRRR